MDQPYAFDTSEALVYFTQFQQTTYLPDAESLLYFFNQGTAIICKRNQETIDLIIPVLLKESTEGTPHLGLDENISTFLDNPRHAYSAEDAQHLADIGDKKEAETMADLITQGVKDFDFPRKCDRSNVALKDVDAEEISVCGKMSSQDKEGVLAYPLISKNMTALFVQVKLKKDGAITTSIRSKYQDGLKKLVNRLRINPPIGLYMSLYQCNAGASSVCEVSPPSATQPLCLFVHGISKDVYKCLSDDLAAELRELSNVNLDMLLWQEREDRDRYISTLFGRYCSLESTSRHGRDSDVFIVSEAGPSNEKRRRSSSGGSSPKKK